VLRHRLVLSYEALAEDLTADDLLEPIVAAVHQPPIVMRDRSEEADLDEAAYQRPAIT
jgi:MoxR-like ATPase